MCSMCKCVSVQYAILHAAKETHNIRSTLTLTFILKNKRRSTMRHATLCATKSICRATESLCSATKNFSQMINQYHKILALCNILWYRYNN